MGDQTDTVTFLTSTLNPAALLLGEEAARYVVVSYESPLQLIKKYLVNCNKQYDLVFSVRRNGGGFSRVLQGVSHTFRTRLDVDVWVVEQPPYSSTAAYVALREAALAEIKRVFTAYPSYGFLSDAKDDDHYLGATKVYNSTFVVTKKSYC